MRLLIGIPCYNESATIAEVIQNIPFQIEGIDDIVVLALDDGSVDDTAKTAEAAGALVVQHEFNRGLGCAFQSILYHALKLRADILVTIDGDGQFNPADIPELISPILSGHSLACTGSRFSDTTLIPDMPWIKKWGNRRVAKLVSSISGRNYYDVSCGDRAYSREALLRLSVYNSFTYTHETFLDLAAKSIFFTEVPLKVRGVRTHGKSRIASSVLRYGLRTSSIMLRFYRDHHPLRLCLYLALPFVVLGLSLLSVSFFNLISTGMWLKWAAFLGGALWGVACMFLFFGFMADISSRLRRNQEELLYWQRKIATCSEDAATNVRARSTDTSHDIAVSSQRQSANEREIL